MPPRRRGKAQGVSDAGARGESDDAVTAKGEDVGMVDAVEATKATDVGPGNERGNTPGPKGGADTDECTDGVERLDTDLVTQLQADLALVCEHLFVGIGSLQRDARPVALDDEEVVGGTGTNTALNATGRGPAGGSAGGATNQASGSGALQPGLNSPLDEEDVQSKAKRLGAELGESLRQLERHIQLLPDGIVYDTSKRRGGEGVESAEVHALLEENRALREELERVVKAREEELKALEDKHRSAVEDLFRCGDA